MYVGDGEAGVTKGIVYSGRFQRAPQHSWHYASPAPTAGSIEASFGSRGMGRRYPRSQRGRGWGSREPDPIAVVADGLGNLGISYTNGNPAAWNGGGSGIDFSAYDDIPVETSGSDVPEPAKTFAEIDLGEALNRNIQRCRYSKPTPVQRYAIPISLAGRDLMACAQTGSGKTAAFCFPIISKLLKSCSAGPKNGSHHRGLACPSALILAPTRELSCQIYDEAKKFSDQTAVRVSVVYGGTPVFSQLHDLAKGVDILVATPGRLMDLIERSRISLHRVNFLTLDEADRMLDMGFEPQIRKIVEETNMPPPGTRQTTLFSATFPHTIQKLASDFLSNYIFLTVGRVGSSTELIKQKVEFVSDMDKRSCLMNLLLAERMKGRNLKLPLTLVFVETKRAADSLQSWLCRNGFPATAIHGDRSQPEREQALKSFKHGATPVMVATDVAARGLDIPHVAHVINFDLPRDIDSYVHRIGRTGRAGNSGLATAFFSGANEPLAKPLVELMKESSQEVPDWLSEYAERSFNGGERSRRCGGSRFGGRDFRKEMTFSSNSADGGSGGGTGYSYGVDDGNCVTGGEISGGAGVDVGKWTVNDAGYDEIVPTGWD